MPRYERVSAAGAIVAAAILAACAGAPAPQGAPSSSPTSAATPSSPASATVASSRTAYLALGPLEAGQHTGNFIVPFTFEADTGWQVISDATDNVVLADASDPTSLLTFGNPTGVTADSLVALLRPKAATVPTAATVAGVKGVRFDYVASEFTGLYSVGTSGAFFGLQKGEKARLFIGVLNGTPVVIVIEASDPATFTAFAPRAEKLLGTVKFQQ
jgi:hypothetical protein